MTGNNFQKSIKFFLILFLNNSGTINFRRKVFGVRNIENDP